MIVLKKEVLKNWLKAIGKNQAFLADQLDITPGYMSQIMNNSFGEFSYGKLSSEIVGKLLVLTKMDFEWLFDIKKHNRGSR